jgi:hypothetical protein
MTQIPARIEFHQTRSFSDLLGVTFEFLRQHAKPLIRGWIFLVGPVALLASLADLYYYDLVGVDESRTAAEPDAVLKAIAFRGLGAFLAAYFTALMIWEYLLLYKEHGRTIEVDMLWPAMKRDFWFLLWTHVAFFIALIIGFILLVIPGIYLSVALSILPVVRLVERQGILEAMSRARRLISGFWWFTLGLIIVISIIQTVFGALLMGPQQILMFLLMLNRPETGDKAGFIDDHPVIALLAVGMGALAYFSYMLYSMTLTFHYFNLVERKEAPNLMDRVDRMGDAGMTGEV